ncbi:MAG: DNA methyltransferase, partial [Aggregatilineales bacterium]
MTNHLIAANAVTRLNSIHCLDAIDLLNALWFAGVKVDCIITSPPYFGLRSYLPDNHPDKEKEIGLEQSMNAYIGNMRRVFRAAYRVLKDTGTLWLNLGDTYNGGGTGFGTKSRGKNNSPLRQKMERINKTPVLPDKCKMMIPHRVAIG